MRISKGTIVRTIMLVIVLINLVLKNTGHAILDISENEVLGIVETILELAIIITTFWKNNSFTKNAQKADEFLAVLRAMENSEYDEKFAGSDFKDVTIEEGGEE